MWEQGRSICLCFILVSLFSVPVKLATLSNQISENNGDYLSEALRNFLKRGEKVDTSLSNRNYWDSNDSINVTFHSKIYTERDCHVLNNAPETYFITGRIEDNSIGFTQMELRLDSDENLIGFMQISPDSNLHGFNVDFGLSKYSDGLQFHFNDDQLLCRNEKTVYQANSVKAEICVRTTGTKRGPGRQIRACFLVGGAILSSQYYDINTINSYNGMVAVITDIGCYTADDTSISYQDNNNNILISETLNTIVQPLHNELCDSAYSNSPFLVTIISSLFALIRFR